MKNIASIKDCFGCGVCATICNKGIINISLNKEGFYTPTITDSYKCTNCGLCLKVCAYYNSETSFIHNTPLKSYAAWSKNLKTRMQCSSGGIGFEIAKNLFLHGYQVYAVKYNTKTNRAEHYLAESLKSLYLSIGSKYIQSYTVDAFKTINKKEKNLIIGTPCQIESIRRYCNIYKIEQNFILIDFFCHGVPSMWAWNRYVKYIKRKTGTFTQVSWRNKSTGWQDSWNMYIEGEKGIYTSRATQGDLFYQLFFRNACLGKACYSHCKYKYNHSAADIRIGDLWGKTYNTNREGVSSLIIFSQKGLNIINELTNDIKLTEHPFTIVAEGQIQHKLSEPTFIRKLIITLLKMPLFPLKGKLPKLAY